LGEKKNLPAAVIIQLARCRMGPERNLYAIKTFEVLSETSGKVKHVKKIPG
jgi:hypothetical protein